MSTLHTRLKVLHAGPSVSVQDQGRYGFMRFGVTGSGAMDRTAMAIANTALGNADTNPVLEISLGGLVLECTEGSVSLAIAGGSFSVLLNNEKLSSWSSFSLSAGDILKIRPGVWGSWCYLAFAGQIESQKWLNSYAVHLNSGVCSAPLKTDSTITIVNTRTDTKPPSTIAEPELLQPDNKIRVVPGPQDRFFDEGTIQKLYDAQYTISADYDRMGMRLSGCPLPVSVPLDMPSEPISRGSLQVPGHGDPICLMADHHTAGGYPKIATVISADQDKLSQLRSGDKLSFAAISTEQAIKFARERASKLKLLLHQVEQNKVSVTEKLWSNNLISGATGGQE